MVLRPGKVGFKEPAAKASDRLGPLLRMYSELSEEHKVRAFDYISRLHQLEEAKSGQMNEARVLLTSGGSSCAPTSSPPRIGAGFGANAGASSAAGCSCASSCYGGAMPADNLDSFVSTVFAPPPPAPPPPSQSFGMPPQPQSFGMPQAMQSPHPAIQAMQQAPQSFQTAHFPSGPMQAYTAAAMQPLSPSRPTCNSGFSPSQLQISLPPSNYPPFQQQAQPTPTWQQQQPPPTSHWQQPPVALQQPSPMAMQQPSPATQSALQQSFQPTQLFAAKPTEEVEYIRNLNSSSRGASSGGSKPGFMCSLTSMHKGMSDSEAMLKERQRQEWLRDLSSQVRPAGSGGGYSA